MAALLSPAIVGRWAVSGSQADPQGRQESYWGLAKVPGLPAVLLISSVATSIIILQQSALPLDLVRGSLGRSALEPVMGNLVVAVQLVLLEVMQPPVERPCKASATCWETVQPNRNCHALGSGSEFMIWWPRPQPS